MQQIRKAVFETNSSSSHSLTVGKGDLVQLPFAKEVLREGVVALSVGEFGWEWARYYKPLNKLSYLLTQAVQGNTPDMPGDALTDYLIKSNREVAMLAQAVRNHTGCRLQIHPGRGYIDHESVGCGGELYSDVPKLEAFLFDADSCIETGNDNEAAPWRIATDRDGAGGTELYYRNAVREVPAHYASVQLKALPRATVYTSTGAALGNEFNESLRKRVQRHGIVTRVTESIGYDPRDIYSRTNVAAVGAAAARELFGTGLALSPELTAMRRTRRLPPTRSEAGGFRVPSRRFVFSVAVPPAIAKALGELAATPRMLVRLDELRRSIARMKMYERRAEQPNPYLAQARRWEAKLTARAMAAGLL